MLESENKTKDMALVIGQMSRYYPDFPQIKEIIAKQAKAAAKDATKGQSNTVKRVKKK